MRQVLSWMYAIVLFAAAGVGTFALMNWFDGKHRPLWTGAAFALVFCLAVPLAMQYSVKRGWIRGLFWMDRQDLQKREQELAAERERIIQEAKAGHS